MASSLMGALSTASTWIGPATQLATSAYKIYSSTQGGQIDTDSLLYAGAQQVSQLALSYGTSKLAAAAITPAFGFAGPFAPYLASQFGNYLAYLGHGSWKDATKTFADIVTSSFGYQQAGGSAMVDILNEVQGSMMEQYQESYNPFAYVYGGAKQAVKDLDKASGGILTTLYNTHFKKKYNFQQMNQVQKELAHSGGWLTDTIKAYVPSWGPASLTGAIQTKGEQEDAHDKYRGLRVERAIKDQVEAESGTAVKDLLFGQFTQGAQEIGLAGLGAALVVGGASIYGLHKLRQKYKGTPYETQGSNGPQPPPAGPPVILADPNAKAIKDQVDQQEIMKKIMYPQQPTMAGPAGPSEVQVNQAPAIPMMGPMPMIDQIVRQRPSIKEVEAVAAERMALMDQSSKSGIFQPGSGRNIVGREIARRHHLPSYKFNGGTRPVQQIQRKALMYNQQIRNNMGRRVI